MPIALDDLAKPMLDAARQSLASDWKKARAYGEPEMKKLAQVLVDIAALAAQGKITELEAKAMLRIHRMATENVLLTIKGLGIIAVENAINAALAAVKSVVNKALPFPVV